jgi:hypothetical protein
LLDVALEHELDLACDIASYGPTDYPMITRLLRVLARTVPEFEFNSLWRWLSPGQLQQLWGRDSCPGDPPGIGTGAKDPLLASAGFKNPAPSALPKTAVPVAERANSRRVMRGRC